MQVEVQELDLTDLPETFAIIVGNAERSELIQKTLGPLINSRWSGDQPGAVRHEREGVLFFRASHAGGYTLAHGSVEYFETQAYARYPLVTFEVKPVLKTQRGVVEVDGNKYDLLAIRNAIRNERIKPL